MIPCSIAVHIKSTQCFFRIIILLFHKGNEAYHIYENIFNKKLCIKIIVQIFFNGKSEIENSQITTGSIPPLATILVIK